MCSAYSQKNGRSDLKRASVERLVLSAVRLSSTFGKSSTDKFNDAVELLIGKLPQTAAVDDLKLAWQHAGNNLQELGRPLDPHNSNGVFAMRLELALQRVEEIGAQLVACALHAAL